MQHTRQPDIIDVSALAGEKLEIFAPLERLADMADSSRNVHG
jgi:hypothetical protein